MGRVEELMARLAADIAVVRFAEIARDELGCVDAAYRHESSQARVRSILDRVRPRACIDGSPGSEIYPRCLPLSAAV
ncbi:hypothetical protein GCM10010259_68860 [Streptomyces daghestanicus]|uniref:Uncharacterized protein n=1 Tax=Streptomyces daghestanicus TaxID=66885 RepID=A0ABQ3PWR8_9ACTN|nr:hypothetical protein GCM10010259_68860 [Streptomyces daghestanicus]GHI29452.1 hypothetical protein Sdagh_11820 [Streptomyces daghestanicus]